jgi:hypothetical protein
MLMLWLKKEKNILFIVKKINMENLSELALNKMAQDAENLIWLGSLNPENRNKLNLTELSQKLDNALSKETPESLNIWMYKNTNLHEINLVQPKLFDIPEEKFEDIQSTLWNNIIIFYGTPVLRKRDWLGYPVIKSFKGIT